MGENPIFGAFLMFFCPYLKNGFKDFDEIFFQDFFSKKFFQIFLQKINFFKNFFPKYLFFPNFFLKKNFQENFFDFVVQKSFLTKTFFVVAEWCPGSIVYLPCFVVNCHFPWIKKRHWHTCFITSLDRLRSKTYYGSPPLIS